MSDQDPWDEHFPYYDPETGAEFTEQEMNELVQSGEYALEEEPVRLPHPDEMTEFGATLRQLWDTLPDQDRRTAKEAYMAERYKEMRNND
jgi:hypothetical protein